MAALRGPEAGTELGMLAVLASPAAGSLPLLPWLHAPCPGPVAEADAPGPAAMGQGLNREQVGVLRYVASWQKAAEVRGLWQQRAGRALFALLAGAKRLMGGWGSRGCGVGGQGWAEVSRHSISVHAACRCWACCGNR